VNTAGNNDRELPLATLKTIRGRRLRREHPSAEAFSEG